MKIDKKLMNEVEELWVGHEEALTHFGQVCVAAAKAGHDCKLRRHLRLGMVVATAATIIITCCLDLMSETY